jgi:predicted O-methyltransferase YrrM
MLPAGAVLYAVDHWEGSETERLSTQYEALQLGPDVMMDVFRRNLHQELVSGKVIPIRATSVEGAKVLREKIPGGADWVFLDGDHEYEPTARDIRLYRALLRPGGLLSGHDYWPDHPGVRRAVDQDVPGAAVFVRSIWGART